MPVKETTCVCFGLCRPNKCCNPDGRLQRKVPTNIICWLVPSGISSCHTGDWTHTFLIHGGTIVELWAFIFFVREIQDFMGNTPQHYYSNSQVSRCRYVEVLLLSLGMVAWMLSHLISALQRPVCQVREHCIWSKFHGKTPKIQAYHSLEITIVLELTVGGNCHCTDDQCTVSCAWLTPNVVCMCIHRCKRPICWWISKCSRAP